VRRGSRALLSLATAALIGATLPGAALGQAGVPAASAKASPKGEKPGDTIKNDKGAAAAKPGDAKAAASALPTLEPSVVIATSTKPARLRPEGNDNGSPRVIFTDPQVGAVGHTLQSAEEAGLRVRAVDVGTGANAGGSFYGYGARGTARIVVDEDRRVLVGATFTGPDIQDTLHAATIAVVAGIGLDDLWHAVPCFPTRSEWWLKGLEAYGL